MTEKLPDTAVRTAMEEGNVDRQARIEALQKKLEKVRKDIAEEERVERRLALLQSAYDKLRWELGKTLTNEERNACDGLYIFLHSGCADFLFHVPSATDKGENRRLLKDLETAEALKELGALLGETAG